MGYELTDDGVLIWVAPESKPKRDRDDKSEKEPKPK